MNPFADYPELENEPISTGHISSFWEEKKRIREEEERWWNSLTEEQRQQSIKNDAYRIKTNYLYND